MTGRNEEAGRAASALTHLITEQDVHAYVDAALPEQRRAAVEAHLARRSGDARRAAGDLRANLALRSLRDVLYADEALRADVERLLARGRPRRVGDDAVSRSAAG